jgi:hypothetical protein
MIAEREWCPFLTFPIDCQAEDGSTHSSNHVPEGSKEFLKLVVFGGFPR